MKYHNFISNINSIVNKKFSGFIIHKSTLNNIDSFLKVYFYENFQTNLNFRVTLDNNSKVNISLDIKEIKELYNQYPEYFL